MNAYAEKTGLPQNYFCNKRKQLEFDYEANKVSNEQYSTVMDLFKQIKERGYVGTTKSKAKNTSEKTSTGTIQYIRDTESRIIAYEFTVPLRDKAPLAGRLTRDEMNMIYRLYSYYGSSITQREVSRSFPEYSLEDFKKILRVFNITKASAPFAPHIIEENTPEQLQVMQLREKENDFLRGIETQRIKQNESLLKN